MTVKQLPRNILPPGLDSNGAGQSTERYDQQHGNAARQQQIEPLSIDVSALLGNEEATLEGVDSSGEFGLEEFSNATVPRSRRPRRELPEDIQTVWDAHPHKDQADESQNTSDEEVNEQQGWDPYRFGNTCAIRMSIMFNNLGGKYAISRKKAAQAGIKPGRVIRSKKTNMWFILSAKEMWKYVTHWFGKPDVEFPKQGRFKSEEEFQEAWSTQIQPLISSKSGIVAFDKIFSYSGTGHVDVFKGESLSDSATWYECKRLKLWFI